MRTQDRSLDTTLASLALRLELGQRPWIVRKLENVGLIGRAEFIAGQDSECRISKLSPETLEPNSPPGLKGKGYPSSMISPNRNRRQLYKN
ncbi:hypothetical protein AJ78_08066 [Emergomyces pasteurianus Ep9510]|uniref:Uncharacterized protein n=1 Tax=Emergomyces pasteurianus Ep9510 TaxID=1447872 RepID=A0A1J9Q4A5_9EURO|nr:hypothetical protein AJ78_08066 [Emergomyces pasteurianus Ep9510]